MINRVPSFKLASQQDWMSVLVHVCQLLCNCCFSDYRPIELMSALHSYWKCHLQNIADADRGFDIRTDASIEFTRFINQNPQVFRARAAASLSQFSP